ncbi:MAG: chemotaxis protein CheW [Gammaproteobacteria bacterium]|nr:chemotaxis protein CheW [Gammaproteobacteria bacterium]
MEKNEADKHDNLTQWVTFGMDGETYGIDVMQVQEVLRITDITPVPGAQPYVLGIINLRGNVVTVIDTRVRFDLVHKTPDEQSRIIIIESHGQVVGLLVDAVSEVAYLRESEIGSAPLTGAEDSRYIHGVHSADGKLLILVDVNKLLSESEVQEMAAS